MSMNCHRNALRTIRTCSWCTKTITMKLRKTQVGQELLRMSNWISQNSWRDLKDQLFAEMDDIWERRLDDFEKSATVDPVHLTESVEVKLIHQMLEFTTTQAPPSKEMEVKCLERFESILIGYSQEVPARLECVLKHYILQGGEELGHVVQPLL